MAVLSKRKVVRCLRGKLKGVRREGKHHTYFDVEHDGMIIADTYVSRGADGDIDDYLIVQMSRQLGVDKQTFIDAVSCTKSRDQVVQEILGPNP